MADARRIGSLDIVRGIAMNLMAIDHVRVYSGLPRGGPGEAGKAVGAVELSLETPSLVR